MTGPDRIQVLNRRTYAEKPFGGKFCNMPNGMYAVLATVDTRKEGFDALTAVSRGIPDAKIISIAPGLLCVVREESEPEPEVPEHVG